MGMPWSRTNLSDQLFGLPDFEDVVQVVELLSPRFDGDLEVVQDMSPERQTLHSPIKDRQLNTCPFSSWAFWWLIVK